MAGHGCKDPIVISGMSGKVPNSDNLAEYHQQIYNKKDMVSNCKRFPRLPDAPERYGAIPTLDKFDNGFFSIRGSHAETMDPNNRIALEITCEALWDAGISLEEIKGSKTGVYTAALFLETEAFCKMHQYPGKDQLISMTRFGLTNKIAHFLKINGPCIGVDSACSSSLFCMEQAVKDLQSGRIDYAIVGAQSLLLSHLGTNQFYRLGVLSFDGKSKSFDGNANGYVRADTFAVIILQRANNAKRQYAEVVKVLTNCDGYKDQGINFPSPEIQMKLFEEFYRDSNISLDKIGFMEAHGTGTRVGDPVELSAIETFFCKDRKDPLLIGSVKSNLGHSEGASGLNAIIKCCWILESGKIAPNINYTKPNPAAPGLFNGKLHVVTEVRDLPEDKPYVASNNFGFGGANGHILLTKPTRSKRQTSDYQETNDILLCITGRTEESLREIYGNLASRPFDPDFIAILNSAFQGTSGLTHRAYCIANKNKLTNLEILQVREDSPPLTYFFHTSGVTGLISELMKFEIFQEHTKNVQKIFSKHQIDNVFFQGVPKRKTIESVLMTIVIQTGIIELLKAIELKPTKFLGSGIGELSAAYADGVLTLEQTILIAHRLIKLLRKNYAEINTNIICSEIEDISTMQKAPTKWKFQKNATVHENLGQYIAEILFEPHIPSVGKENVLIIGGSSTYRAGIFSLCDKNAKLGSGFLDVIGKLHLNGYNLNVNKLFSIQWPVKAQTPMISPLVKWKHTKSFNVAVKFDVLEIRCFLINQYIRPDWLTLHGHNIDGRILFPATGYLILAWQCISRGRNVPIKFENVAFLRACSMTPGQNLLLTVQVQKESGKFQVFEGDTILVSGVIKEIENFDNEWMNLPALPVPNKYLAMNKRDVYKELGLRGYYYQGQFKEIQSCDVSGRVAHIKWTEWCPFLDNILQMKILSEDTRSLYVPTKIRHMIINPEKHLDIVYTSEDIENCILPAYHYKDLDLIRCGFVEVRGLQASSIAKRKNPTPILEANKFIPYEAYLDLENAARVIAQIALENSYALKVKVVEEFNEVPESMESMLPYLQKALNDQPLIQPEFTLFSTKDQQLPNIPTMNRTPSKEDKNFIAIGYNLSQNSELCKVLLESLKDCGYLISRENLKQIKTNNNFKNENCSIICQYTTPTEKVLMLRPFEANTMPKPIHINENGFSWVAKIQESRNRKENVLIYSENEANNGLMGLTNCLLREAGAEKIMNVLIDDLEAPKFDVSNEFYKEQLSKGLAINVFKNGAWGSYRHLLINKNATIQTIHCCANNTTRGDLSSLTWTQSKLSIPDNFNNKHNGVLVHIYNSSVNFKDVMLASGKLTVESLIKERILQDNCIGFECSGRTERGQRVMALANSEMFSNLAQVKHFWPIPDSWTMSEAATVPCVYLTNIYGLKMRAQIKKGESILIHSATGGIGLSALNIALYYKCEIFVTVGTPEKIQFILNNYPMIPVRNIGNSRDTSFYEQILKETNGKGVDLILNSLADEKLQTSVKCLAQSGRFVEIGKFDCTQDSPLHIELTNKEAEYHGVMLDQVLMNPGDLLNVLGKEMMQGVEKGYIKPIPHVVFEGTELEKAFRYMTTGKHIGKVVVSLREEEKEKNCVPRLLKHEARPKLYCNPIGTYILLGGLGGFGLELADLLVLRGARNIVLVSRHGITTGYQALRIKTWESYDCTVKISSADCTTQEGCLSLLEESSKLGPILGIFNLAVVLADAIFENQNEDTFCKSYNPKAQSTIHLDTLSRKLCPNLEHFVVFSSVSCGRGNAGQTNYGYSNSVMERIVEQRVKSGLPGKAIQWGVVGDVGIVADYKEQNVEIVIGGTLHQRIASCLEVMDTLLFCEDAIVSSMVVAEKQADANNDDAVQVVAGLLHIKDIKSVSPNSTFPELGMDSMMGVEIKQTLERDFDIFLSPQELRNMNFAKLAELTGGNDDSAKIDSDKVQNQKEIVKNLLQFIPEKENCKDLIVHMKISSDSRKCLYLIPGIEGMSTIFEPLVENLNRKLDAKCLQFPIESSQRCMMELVQQKFKILKTELNPNEKFLIGAHSMGVTVALETVSLLEEAGLTGTLLILDGSPLANKKLLTSLFATGSEESVQIAVITNIMSSLLPMSKLDQLKTLLVEAGTFEEKCELAVNTVEEKNGHSTEFLCKLLNCMYGRIRAELSHEFKPRKYKSTIVLCKAAISYMGGLPEDFGLKKIVGDELEIQEFNGDHISFLRDANLGRFIKNVVKD